MTWLSFTGGALQLHTSGKEGFGGADKLYKRCGYYDGESRYSRGRLNLGGFACSSSGVCSK